VLEGYTNFPRDSFDKHLETFYPLAVGLLEKEIGSDLRSALWGMFRRVGEVKFNMPEWVGGSRGRDGSVSSVSRERRNGSVSATPSSPTMASASLQQRRGSRVSSRIGSI
jgi:hypothetical protein